MEIMLIHHVQLEQILKLKHAGNQINLIHLFSWPHLDLWRKTKWGREMGKDI